MAAGISRRRATHRLGRIVVATSRVRGEGISLHTVCHNAIYLDRDYDAAQFLQSQDRIHRLGLPANVITHIEILVAPNSSIYGWSGIARNCSSYRQQEWCRTCRWTVETV